MVQVSLVVQTVPEKGSRASGSLRETETVNHGHVVSLLGEVCVDPAQVLEHPYFQLPTDCLTSTTSYKFPSSMGPHVLSKLHHKHRDTFEPALWSRVSDNRADNDMLIRGKTEDSVRTQHGEKRQRVCAVWIPAGCRLEVVGRACGGCPVVGQHAGPVQSQGEVDDQAGADC